MPLFEMKINHLATQIMTSRLNFEWQGVPFDEHHHLRLASVEFPIYMTETPKHICR